jgi:hypothetical protein
MESGSHVPAWQVGGAPGGARQQNPPVIDVSRYDIVRYVVDGLARTVPTFTITIRMRHEVEVEIRGEVAVVGRDGITLVSGDRRLDIDHRYNTAVEEVRHGGVAVAERVAYRGAVYEAREFVELFRRRVRELIEEAASTVGL